MNRCFRSLSCLLAVAAVAFVSTEATARTNPKQQQARKTHQAKEARPHRSAAVGKHRHARQADAQQKSKRSQDASPPKEAAPPLTGDLALVKEAIGLARKAKTDEATATRNGIADPAARKLVEWFILRHPETTAHFSRYAAFLAANPEWPSAALLRRRAEARLWQERSDAATVRSFTGDRPISARGKLALARVLLADGDRDGAGRLAREAWRSDELSERVETEAYELFRDLFTREDHVARTHREAAEGDDPTRQVPDPGLLLPREETQLLFQQLDPAPGEGAQLVLPDLGHQLDPGGVHPVDDAFRLCSRPLELGPCVEEVRQVVEPGHGSHRLGKEIQPGWVEPTAQRQVCNEPVGVFERCDVVDRKGEDDVPGVASYEVHQASHGRRGAGPPSISRHDRRRVTDRPCVAGRQPSASAISRARNPPGAMAAPQRQPR